MITGPRIIRNFSLVIIHHEIVPKWTISIKKIRWTDLVKIPFKRKEKINSKHFPNPSSIQGPQKPGQSSGTTLANIWRKNTPSMSLNVNLRDRAVQIAI